MTWAWSAPIVLLSLVAIAQTTNPRGEVRNGMFPWLIATGALALALVATTTTAAFIDFAETVRIWLPGTYCWSVSMKAGPALDERRNKIDAGNARIAAEIETLDGWELLDWAPHLLSDDGRATRTCSPKTASTSTSPDMTSWLRCSVTHRLRRADSHGLSRAISTSNHSRSWSYLSRDIMARTSLRTSSARTGIYPQD